MQEVLSRSFAIWTRHWRFFALMALMSWLPESLPAALAVPQELALVVWLASTVVSVFWWAVSLHYAGQAAQGQTPSLWPSVIAASGRWMSFFWTWLVYSLTMVVGFVLFIVPGILWAFRYALCQIASLEEDKSGNAALQRSKQLIQVDRRLASNVLLGLPLLICIPYFALAMLLPPAAQTGLALLGNWIFQLISVAMVVLFHHLRDRLRETHEDNIGFSRF